VTVAQKNQPVDIPESPSRILRPPEVLSVAEVLDAEAKLRVPRQGLVNSGNGQSKENKFVVCIAEDRDDYEVPLQCLILSLMRHSPQLSIYLFYPPASLVFSLWLQTHSKVVLYTQPLSNVHGWNIKPHAILRLFELGYNDVIWIDSDT
jgi:hypothetical protein